MLALVAIVTVILTMAVGPLQSYTAATDRVEALERTRDQLRAEVDSLEERRERLEDPEELELLARSEHGLVRPGEIPFVVVVPDADPDRVRPEPPTPGEPADGPWYRRLGRALAELFGEGS